MIDPDTPFKSVLVQVHEEAEEAVTASYLFENATLAEARRKAELFHRHTEGRQAYAGDIFCSDAPIQAMNTHAVSSTKKVSKQ